MSLSFDSNNHASTSQRDDRRANLRVPVRVQVTFVYASVRQHGWVVNLSEGGMYVDILTQAPNGTEVMIEALVRDEDRPFKLRAAGKVIRTDSDGTDGIPIDPAWGQ